MKHFIPNKDKWRVKILSTGLVVYCEDEEDATAYAFECERYSPVAIYPPESYSHPVIYLEEL